MGLCDLCVSCKCGLCCFTAGLPDKQLSGFDDDFLSKYSSKLVKRGGDYLINNNSSIELIIDSLVYGFDNYSACGFLQVRTVDSFVSELYCLIHPKILGFDYRPSVCKLQNYLDCEINQLTIKGFLINGVLFGVNDSLKRWIA